MAQRVIVDPVTRIEGHARIVVDVDGGDQVTDAHLQVLEIRGFEKLLERMELFKMPQVTGRLCGVCPAAHHLASVTAIENGLGIAVPTDARLLRDLLYAGHMLHSHGLSTFVLLGPDLLLGLDSEPDVRNVFGLLKLAPELAKKALRLRTIGQRIVEIVGGRGVHPVTAVPGGMAARPDAEKLKMIAGWGTEAMGLLDELGPVARARLALMDEITETLLLPYHSLSLSKNGVHSFLEGDVVVTDALGIRERVFPIAKYYEHLVEHVMRGSYMKSVRLRGTPEKRYFVGALARLNNNYAISTPKANQMLKEFQAKGRPRLSALDYVEARLVEMVHAAERVAEIAGGALTGGPIRVPVEPREGRYIGLVEAPRGILVHDYTADADGRLTDANLIVATQNNYDAIDNSIGSLAKLLMPKKNDNLLMNGIEFAMRCFDPCLACATHAAGQMPMEVQIRRDGELVRTIRKGMER
ncbi:MAG: Ni/Fe hydrogenase subunit alpha [Acidobacteriota bacterium]